MVKYTLDPGNFSMERFLELIRIKKLIPSRVCLKEQIEERFRRLMKHGIRDLGQLITCMDSREKLTDLAIETGIPLEYLLLLNREARSYLARPFPISKFPGIPFEFCEVLRTKELRSTRDFFERVRTPEQRKRLSLQTGIPENRLAQIHALCDLTRITGVGARFAKILYDSGIRSTPELANADARELVSRFRDTTLKQGIPDLGEDDIQYCINYARTITEMT
jgi:hypothetical protein